MSTRFSFEDIGILNAPAAPSGEEPRFWDTCAVQVRGQNGLFQIGRIVERSGDSLIINWECERKPASERIPFGEIYFHKPEQFQFLSAEEIEEFAKGKEYPVEVLQRPSLDSPRTWYPGILLVGELSVCPQYLLMKALLPSGDKVVVVSGHEIREGLTKDTLDMLRVQKDQFDQQTPKNHHLQETISVTEELSSEDLDEAVQDEPVASHTPLFQQQRKRKLSETDLEPPSNDSVEPATTPPTTPAPTYTFHLLPKHTVAEIFQYMDTVEQRRIRRVCSDWKGILVHSHFDSLLRVHYEEKKQDILSVASLHYGWTSQTQVILSAGLDTDSHPLYCGGLLYRALVDKKLHAPVQTIVLSDMAWNVEARGFNRCFAGSIGRLVDELNHMAGVCKRLVLRNLNIVVHTGQWPEKATNVRILTGLAAGPVSLTAEKLWTCLDEGLPYLDQSELHLLTEWISGAISQRKGFPRFGILDILNNRQSSDPREKVSHQGRIWNAADLGALDLHTLSKLTLHSLFALKNGTSMTVPVSL